MVPAPRSAACWPTLRRRGQQLLIGVGLALAVLVSSLSPLRADSPAASAVLHVFWSQACAVCVRQKPWIEGLERRFPGLQVEALELPGSPRVQALFKAMAEARGASARHVPTLMLGPRVWVGDGPEQRAEIEAAIAALLAGADPAPAPGDRLPLLGNVDPRAAPLLALTALIAFVDGFNPCSLWVLTLLLGLVLASGSRRRVALVGLTFLGTTALIYGAFIAGLFSVLAFAFALPWVRWAVALFALVFGMVNIKDYLWPGRGISVSIPAAEKPGIYQRFRQLRQQPMSPPVLIVFTVAMAAGIALVELPCTAGFPVVWSGFLAERAVAPAGFVALLAVYVLIYLSVELLIFAIAITTMRLGRMGERQGRALKLLGGTVMVALAGALALRPELMEDLQGTLLLFGSALALVALVLLLQRLRPMA